MEITVRACLYDLEAYQTLKVKVKMTESMPKILSPINSLEDATRVISAGADEVYCGAKMSGKLKNFVLYRGPGTPLGIRKERSAQRITYDELGRIVDYAHGHGVKVILVVNEPFMSEELEEEMRGHIGPCLDEGVDALIIGDIGTLLIAKDMGVKVPLYASTYFISTNREAVDFLRKLGFSRIILDRHLTINEISDIVKHSKVDIEVFCHGPGCSNINGNCYLYHGHLYYHLKRAWEEEKTKLKRSVPPCMFTFEVYDADRLTKIGKAPILDAHTYCSLCNVWALVQAGVHGLKIVGREHGTEHKETETRVYRKILDFIARGQVRPKKLRKRISLLRKELDTIYSAGMGGMRRLCEEKHCYYSPLFERSVRYHKRFPIQKAK